jgi:penicillin amidase
VTQLRTVDGPVVLNSSATHTAFAKKSSYWMRELQSEETFMGLWHAQSATEADHAVQRATMNFNVFYVTASGDAGYRYAGTLPLRAVGVDPRFPALGGHATAWRGLIPPEQLPHALNPASGFFANWNNKPAAWWPNGDTPVWGRIFRNADITESLPSGPLNAQDLETAAFRIARMDETWPYFRPYIEPVVRQMEAQRRPTDPRLPTGSPEPFDTAPIAGFDGRLLDGSRQAATYQRFIGALREELFLGTTGNFMSAVYFNLIAQPSVMLRALERKTKVDYLHGRTADEVVRKALDRALSGAVSQGEPVRFHADGIPVPGQRPIPYSDRGSFIQVVEMLPGGMRGRSVVTPGLAASGPHAFDQVDLARSWLYKPMGD